MTLVGMWRETEGVNCGEKTYILILHKYGNNMGCFLKSWVFPPNHPLKNRVFHYFHHPFWGNPPIFGSTPIWQKIKKMDCNAYRCYMVKLCILIFDSWSCV